jgi:Spy/CpxP family protein refolding chaperone
MKKRKILIIGLASVLTIGGLSVLVHARDHGKYGAFCHDKGRMSAHHPGHWGKGGSWHHARGTHGQAILYHLERQVNDLGLNKAQREQVYAVLDENRPVLRNLSSDLAENHRALKTLSLNTENYPQRLSELASKQAELNQKKIVKIGEIRSKVFALLNEEQKANLLKWQEKPRKMW